MTQRRHRIDTASTSRPVSAAPLPFDQVRLENLSNSHNPSTTFGDHSDAASFSQASLFDINTWSRSVRNISVNGVCGMNVWFGHCFPSTGHGLSPANEEGVFDNAPQSAGFKR